MGTKNKTRFALIIVGLSASISFSIAQSELIERQTYDHIKFESANSSSGGY